MTMSARELNSIVAELSPLLPGAFLRKVERVSREEWALHLTGGKQKFLLLLALSPAASRLHLLSRPLDTGVDLDPFGRMVKKRLLRSCLSAVEQINDDRVVELRFETMEGTFRIMAELMGSRGNLYLVDDGGRIIAMAFNRNRGSKPGELYAPPSAPPHFDQSVRTETTNGSPLAANRALEERLRVVADEERLARARSGSLGRIKKEIKRLVKRLASVAAEKEKLAGYREDKLLGDLLSAHFHLLQKGAEQVTVVDHFNNGVERTLRLDPKLSPQENVAHYYKRSRKYEKGLPRLDAERRSVQEKIAGLTDELTRIESLCDLKTLLAERQEITGRKQARPVASPTSGKNAPSIGRRFTSSEGYPIMVGRSDTENDQLTTRVANGRDIWLHTRDYPGSHVLIKLPKKIELPRTALEEAAMLALKYSKAAKAGKGEVTWCYAKWVKKPKGFPPGKVLVNNPQSIFVRIDDERIARLKEKG